MTFNKKQYDKDYYQRNKDRIRKNKKSIEKRTLKFLQKELVSGIKTTKEEESKLRTSIIIKTMKNINNIAKKILKKSKNQKGFGMKKIKSILCQNLMNGKEITLKSQGQFGENIAKRISLYF